jgi:hypothetical protein
MNLNAISFLPALVGKVNKAPWRKKEQKGEDSSKSRAKKCKTQSESQRGKGTNYDPDPTPEANQQKKGMGNLKEQ